MRDRRPGQLRDQMRGVPGPGDQAGGVDGASEGTLRKLEGRKSDPNSHCSNIGRWRESTFGLPAW